jgi:hypothetical protein
MKLVGVIINIRQFSMDHFRQTCPRSKSNRRRNQETTCLRNIETRYVSTKHWYQTERTYFHRKYRKHRNQLEANEEIVAQEDKNNACCQTEVHNEMDMKNATKTRYDPQLSLPDSCSSNCISEELLDEEQQYQISSNSSTTRKKTFMKPVNTTLITIEKGSNAFNEDTALIDDNSNLPMLDGPMNITGKPNVMQSSFSQIPIIADTPIARSMKSLKIIFPSTSQTKYEHMFLLEKIAFIYIELVIKRGYKSMSNRPFRNLAR